MVRGGTTVSLSLGNWIGIVLILVLLIVPFWSWTNKVSENQAANTKAITELKESQASMRSSMDLILAALIPPTDKERKPDAKTQANALR